MPARKRRKRQSIIKKERKKNILRPLTVSVLLFIIIFLTFLLSGRDFWDGKGKFSVVIRKETGDIMISTFDPNLGEITNVFIPANTQVEVARGLGVWKIGSVWELAENEGLTGDLVAETVTRYFKFPVVAWADQQAEGFSNTNWLDLIKAVAPSYKTNLKIGDRVGIALFAIRVQNTGRIDIDLAQNSFLKETTFVDGGEGYVVTGSASSNLLSIFADPDISREENRVVIKDLGGKSGLANSVGEIVEVLGAKVVSITKEKNRGEEVLDCVVKGKDRKMAEKIARLFSCGLLEEEINTSIDLEITIGAEFAKRY